MHQNLNKSFKRTKAGNYFGYYNGYYIFAMKCISKHGFGHGGYFCQIGRKGQWLWSEGYHAKSLPTLKKLKQWVKCKIEPHCPTSIYPYDRR